MREPACERAREQIRQREQSTLCGVEHVEVLDGLVHLAVLGLAQAIAIRAFKQHADEGVQEMQILGGGLQGERIDLDAAVPQSQLEIAAVEERCELPIAVPEIEDDRQRVVLLCVHHQKVEQEALAAAGGAEDERVTDVVHVQIEVVGRLMLRLEDCQRLGVQVGLRTCPVSSVKRKLRSA